MHIIRPFKNYPGNKAAHGLAQKIISIMPPHDVYVETFLGSGAILSMKKPAESNVGNDIDPVISDRWKPLSSIQYTFTNMPAIEVISIYEVFPGKVLFYHDPPYLKTVRRCDGDIYDFEMHEEASHIDLLDCISSSKQLHIISGYESGLYNKALQGWTKMTMPASSRRWQTIEVIWFNFPVPTVIHDYRFIGKNFNDRQRIKRKVDRWIQKFENLPDLERNLIFQELHKKSASLGSI